MTDYGTLLLACFSPKPAEHPPLVLGFLRGEEFYVYNGYMPDDKEFFNMDNVKIIKARPTKILHFDLKKLKELS